MLKLYITKLPQSLLEPKIWKEYERRLKALGLHLSEDEEENDSKIADLAEKVNITISPSH